jgi:nicotianamine synthase
MIETKLEIENELREIHRQLMGISYEPSFKLNQLMKRIASISKSDCDASASIQILDSIKDILPSFWEIQSEAESLLEKDWANAVINSSTPQETMENFPYYQGYNLLVKNEVIAIQSVLSERLKALIFIGSGPLPISAILLAQKYNYHVVCIDSDIEAIKLASQVVQKLGLKTSVSFLHMNAFNLEKLPQDMQCVYVAALVGITSAEKQSVFQELAKQMNSNQVVCVRSSENLKALHYLPVDPDDMKPFIIRKKSYPPAPVVNHSLIASLR